MNNFEKSAVFICSYEAYRDLLLEIFGSSGSKMTVICAADTNETEVTLKALHQFNLGRDKILRQLAEGSLHIQNWVRDAPGPYLKRWLLENGSPLGSSPASTTPSAAGGGRKRKLEKGSTSSDGSGTSSEGGGGGGENGAVEPLDRFHPVDAAEDAYAKELYFKKLQELRKLLIDRVKNFRKFLKEYHSHFLKEGIKTGVTEMFVEVINHLRSARHDITQLFYRDKQININAKDLKAMVDVHTEATVKAALVTLLNQRRVLFPLKRYLKDYLKFGSMFNKLQAMSEDRNYRRYFKTGRFQMPAVIKFDMGRAPLFPFTYGSDPRTATYMQFQAEDTDRDYWEMDMLTDFFTEHLRMKARRADTEKSVWEAFHTDPEFQRRLVDATLRRGEGFTPHSMREAVYKVIKECTQFKASLTVCIFRKFGATRVLDISAGWGDRLLGALACGVKRYVATDPNRDLRPGHNKLINKLLPLSKHKPSPEITILYEPFQTAKLPEGETFDLVFTSPPFFDFEIYTQLAGQSVQGSNARLENWLVNFLFYSLDKAWQLLDAGGSMAIHVTDVMHTKVCEPMCCFMQWKLPGARYMGVIGCMGSARQARPIWVFRKNADGFTDRTRAQAASRLLAGKFPDVHKLAVAKFGS